MIPDASAYAGLGLSPEHVEVLRQRAILPDVAQERGVRTVRTQAELERLGFARQQCRTPALLIPMHNTLGELVNYAIRPDGPRIVRGKPAKYEPVKGSSLTLDVPRRSQEALRDAARRLFLTESPFKGDAAVSQGADCIDLLRDFLRQRHATVWIVYLPAVMLPSPIKRAGAGDSGRREAV